MKNKLRLAKLSLLVAVFGLLSISCTSIPFVPDVAIMNKIFGAPPPHVEKRIETLAKDGYKQIVAFSRPDETGFTKDDLEFLKTNSPQIDSRTRKTDDEKFVIIGTNTPFTEAQFEILRQRFVFKDFSKQYVKTENANANMAPKSPQNANVEVKNTNLEVKNANVETKNANLETKKEN
jgi:hypothetical protein